MQFKPLLKELERERQLLIVAISKIEALDRHEPRPYHRRHWTQRTDPASRAKLKRVLRIARRARGRVP